MAEAGADEGAAGEALVAEELGKALILKVLLQHMPESLALWIWIQMCCSNAGFPL